jgi:GDPmannose 4,6-dehydratase
VSKTALITGITGQDGSYLSEILLEKGYEVHGVIRRSSWPNTDRIDHIFDPEGYTLIHYGDLAQGVDDLLYSLKPDIVVNLAAMSHVRISFDVPVYTVDINAVGPLRILEGIRKVGLAKTTRFYQASSSEMFGLTPPPQNENTIMAPASPYGCAKLAAYHLTKVYRQSYTMFASNGILFNHESPRRGVNFVTRKVTRLASKIKLGILDKIRLGNLEASRDWGHSRDYMLAVYKILHYSEPNDFVISTGEAHTVREFAEEVFNYLGLDFYDYLVNDDRYRRPVEVPALLGDSTKARTLLGWEPQVTFKQLVKEMVDFDMMEEARALRNNT